MHHYGIRLAVAAVAGVLIGVPVAGAESRTKRACVTDACRAAKAAADAAAAQAAAKALRDKKAAILKERKDQRTAAENKRLMDAEIVANKAIAAKRAAEPGVTKQVCNMVNGKLVCR